MEEHRRWEQAWSEAYGQRSGGGKDAGPRGGWLAARRERRPWLLHAGLAGLMLGTLVTPFAVAATGDALREGVRNGTSSRETEIIGRFNASTGAKGGYVTRQSNTQTGARAGGGAIYGCRGAAGGTAAGSAPCLRASNLANGYAFELSTGGSVTGLITAGNPGAANPNARPFVTNATAVATGLNADKVDGKDASELVGPTGPAGAPGVSGLQQVDGNLATGAGDHTSSAVCPSGKRALSGGYSTASIDDGNLSISTAAVLADGVTFRVDGRRAPAEGDWNLRANVLCATVAP